MSDNNGSAGGVAGAAHDLLAEMIRAQTQVQRLEQQRAASATSFDEVLQQKHVRTQSKALARRVNAAREASLRAGEVLRQAQTDAGQTSGTTVGEAEKRGAAKLVVFIQDVVRGQDRMNYIMDLCLSGHHIDPYSLVNLQAAVYRFTQELELTTKVVDNATADVKQTFNIQV
jgi:hypothetical protein